LTRKKKNEKPRKDEAAENSDGCFFENESPGSESGIQPASSGSQPPSAKSEDACRHDWLSKTVKCEKAAKRVFSKKHPVRVASALPEAKLW